MLVASMSQDAYLSRKEVNRSYRPRNYVGLTSSIPLAIRVHVHRRRRRSYPQASNARAPFRLQKVLTGVVVTGFATAVWAYSIRAIKQDDFSDVDEEAREMMKGKMSLDDDGCGLSVFVSVGREWCIVLVLVGLGRWRV